MIRREIHPSAVIDFQGDLLLPDTTIIEPLCAIYGGPEAQLHLGERNTLYPHCTIRLEKGSMRTGVDVSFGPGCRIYETRGGLVIGDFCMIAAGTIISGAEHSNARLDVPMRQQAVRARRVVIEDDVWIGMGVVILPGVTIGQGSVIGAGSVVTRSLPPRSIAYGTPCRVRGSRGDRGLESSYREGVDDGLA